MRQTRLQLLVLVLAMSVHGMVLAQNGKWVGTWAASPQAPPVNGVPFASGLNNRTIRNVVHTTVGGSAVRVRLSNLFGNQSVTFDSIFIGRQRSGAEMVSGTNRRVTFGGKHSVKIPAGGEALSDPVKLAVDAGQNLSVSLFVASATGRPTTHNIALQTNYVSAPGNFAVVDNGAAFNTPANVWYFLTSVDVFSPRVQGVVVALGDSITDGTASTPDANHRWPNFLAQRFVAGSAGPAWSVLDAGIAGNCLLGNAACIGPSAIARTDRDAFSQAGVTHVILLEGLNDIGIPAASLSSLAPFACFLHANMVPPEQIIAGYQRIAAQAHARGLKIYAGTLTPFRGAVYWTTAGETTRAAVNRWIKTSKVFDGVIDFAAAVADPANPLILASQYDSGDHLHPSDAGYQAMANAIQLSLFQPPSSPAPLAARSASVAPTATTPPTAPAHAVRPQPTRGTKRCSVVKS